MIDKTLEVLLQQLRERRAGDVFRYVRYGEMQKAIIALGAVDAIDEIFRYYDIALEAETRADSVTGQSHARIQPERVRPARQHDFPNLQKKESHGA